MYQDDEAVGAYLYYVHDTSTIDTHTLVDKATSELFPLGSDDIARHLEISEQIRSRPIQRRRYARGIEETVEPQES